MRVLVCGGRLFGVPKISTTQPSVPDQTWRHERQFLKDVLSQIDITVLIHGMARGADQHAERYAIANNIPTVGFTPMWKEYGKAGGPIRNRKMLEEGKPDLVVAFPGGKGTAHMVKLAKEAGIKVIETGPVPTS